MKLKKYTSKVSLLAISLALVVVALLGTILWNVDNRHVINETQAQKIAYGYAVQDCFKALSVDAGICSKLKVSYSTDVKDDPVARTSAYWQYSYFIDGTTNNFSTDVSLDRTGQRFTLDKSGQWIEVK